MPMSLDTRREVLRVLPPADATSPEAAMVELLGSLFSHSGGLIASAAYELGFVSFLRER